MKKIVGLMKSVFSNHHSDHLDAKSKVKVNYWCPTGMNPMNYNF